MRASAAGFGRSSQCWALQFLRAFQPFQRGVRLRAVRAALVAPGATTSARALSMPSRRISPPLRNAMLRSSLSFLPKSSRSICRTGSASDDSFFVHSSRTCVSRSSPSCPERLSPPASSSPATPRPGPLLHHRHHRPASPYHRHPQNRVLHPASGVSRTFPVPLRCVPSDA